MFCRYGSVEDGGQRTKEEKKKKKKPDLLKTVAKERKKVIKNQAYDVDFLIMVLISTR